MTNHTGLPWCENNTTSMPPRPLDQAVLDAVCINKIINDLFGGEKKGLKGFPSRARELPTMLSTYGLLPTLTFLFSKSDKNQELIREIDQITKTDTTNDNQGNDTRTNRITDTRRQDHGGTRGSNRGQWNLVRDEFTKEGKGYALTLYLLMRYLESLQIISFQGQNNYNSEAILEAIETLLNISKSGELTRISAQLIEYSVELKKLVQGIVGEEE